LTELSKTSILNKKTDIKKDRVPAKPPN